MHAETQARTTPPRMNAGTPAAGIAGAGALGKLARIGTLVGLAAIAAVAVTLTACASKTPRQPREADAALTAPVADADAKLPRFQIRDWSAPNDHTIIVIANDGTRYRAETFGPCLGLDFANRLAFESRGGFEQVDRFSSVLLGDGTRCQFQSFGKLKAPETKALDDYEKSQKSGETEKPASEKAEGDSAEPK
jgi:hypothetical protein